jgi:preprotein translocase subunit SecY
MNFKTIFKSLKNKDMRKRILAVVGLLVAYRIIAHIPVPLGDAANFKTAITNLIESTNLGGFINLISGGGLADMSIIMVGLSPYITASIVMQVLTKGIPQLEELSKDGEVGRRKINQWTRILTVPLAIVQSITYIYLLSQRVLSIGTTGDIELTKGAWALGVACMTAGSILLMWLGELITEKGIGNGTSTIILCSIVANFPRLFSTMTMNLFNTSNGTLNLFGWLELPVDPNFFWTTIALVLGLILVLYLLVKLNEAQRIVTVNYAKRVHGNSAYGGIKSIIPIKLISAGVIPVIFAVAFLSVPSFIGQVIERKDPNSQIAANLIELFTAPNSSDYNQYTGLTWKDYVYPACYFVLVILFTYIYTSVMYNTQDYAENLQKQGGFIEGVRPGKQTEKYFSNIMNRLNLFGSVSLGLIAMLPYIIDFIAIKTINRPLDLSISGTSLLIVVTVAIENIRTLNSRALMVTYDVYK